MIGARVSIDARVSIGPSLAAIQSKKKIEWPISMVGYLFQNYNLSIQRSIYIFNQSIYIFNETIYIQRKFKFNEIFIFNEKFYIQRKFNRLISFCKTVQIREKSKWKQGFKIRHYSWPHFYIIPNYLVISVENVLKWISFMNYDIWSLT